MSGNRVETWTSTRGEQMSIETLSLHSSDHVLSDSLEFTMHSGTYSLPMH